MLGKIRIPLSKTIDDERVIRHYYEIDIYTDSVSYANHCETHSKECNTIQEAIDEVQHMIQNDKDLKESGYEDIKWVYTITLCEETKSTVWTTTYKVYTRKGVIGPVEID